MSEAIQTEWETLTLGHIFSEIRNGCSIEQNSLQSGVPVTRIETISSGQIDYQKTGWLETDEDIERYKLDRGDILLSHINSMSHIGKVAIKSDDRVLYHGMNLLKLKVNKDICEPIFAYNLLTWDRVRESLRNRAKQAINQASINVHDIKTLAYALPPLPEQQKIATILSSVDDVLEKTRVQIDKLKDLKTGMMQELLTQGIGHTEFKDSPVGRIPASWHVEKIDDLVSKVGSGITPKGGSDTYLESGIPLIRSQNVHSDGLRLEDVSFISLAQHNKMHNSQLKGNDVLLNITGASIGRCYYLPRDFGEANVNQHVCIIRPKPNLCNHVYLALFLNAQEGQRQIMSLQAGGNREGLNFQQVRSITLALPPVAEQIEIAKTVSSIESNIRSLNRKFLDLADLKKALMQDLLTGKVRVKFNSPEVAAA